MNWFHRIILVLTAFVGMMVFFAVRSIQAPLDLVTEKYYEEELHYQDRIEQIANGKELAEPVRVSLQAGMVQIDFPPTLNAAGIQGKVRLYCPSGKRRDREYPISLVNGLSQQIDVSGLKGAYSVQVDWNYQDRSYYAEHKLFF